MATPTIAEVKDIKATVLSDAAITARISSAGTITGRINDSCGESFTTTELEDIQLWLAAHLVAISDPDPQEERIASLEIRVRHQVGKLGKGVESTLYGQTANSLSSGCLASLMDSQQAVAQFA